MPKSTSNIEIEPITFIAADCSAKQDSLKSPHLQSLQNGCYRSNARFSLARVVATSRASILSKVTALTQWFSERYAALQNWNNTEYGFWRAYQQGL